MEYKELSPIFYSMKQLTEITKSFSESISEMLHSNVIESPNSTSNLEKYDENKINRERLEFLRKHTTPRFIKLIREEHFEFGYTSQSEIFLRELLEKNSLATMSWLNELYNDNFHNDVILIGIVRLLGRFDEASIKPQGQTMALGSLIHKNLEICELGIRAFESWGSTDSLRILKQTRVSVLKQISIADKWLKQYLEEVISDLEEDHALSNTKI